VKSPDALLVVLLVLDGVQALAGIAALVQGRRRARSGELELARYSFRHAALLLVAALLLAIPLLLGLTGAIGARTALWIVVAAEVVGVTVARVVLGRLDVAARA
jgi:hypothetical protein